MWTYLVTLWIMFAIAAGVAARLRNRDVLESVALGGLLGFAGFLIVITAPEGPPRPPDGTFTYTCRRCNAVQNVARDAADMDCWQCGRKVKFQTAAA